MKNFLITLCLIGNLYAGLPLPIILGERVSDWQKISFSQDNTFKENEIVAIPERHGTYIYGKICIVDFEEGACFYQIASEDCSCVYEEFISNIGKLCD